MFGIRRCRLRPPRARPGFTVVFRRSGDGLAEMDRPRQEPGSCWVLGAVAVIAVLNVVACAACLKSVFLFLLLFFSFSAYCSHTMTSSGSRYCWVLEDLIGPLPIAAENENSRGPRPEVKTSGWLHRPFFSRTVTHG